MFNPDASVLHKRLRKSLGNGRKRFERNCMHQEEFLGSISGKIKEATVLNLQRILEVETKCYLEFFVLDMQ